MRWTRHIAVALGIAALAGVGSSHGPAAAGGNCTGNNPPPVCSGGREPATEPGAPVAPQPDLGAPLTPVSAPNQFPYRPVVRIVSANWASSSLVGASGCTGFVYAPNAVATAAHCIWDRTGNVVTGGKVVYEWANGNLKWCNVVDSFVPMRWRELTAADTTPETQTAEQTRWDYGAVRVDCRIGDQRGILPLVAVPTPGPAGAVSLGVADAVCVYSLNHSSVWKASVGTSITSAQPGVVSYHSQIEPGCSGGPVITAGAAIGINSTAGRQTPDRAHQLTASSIADLDGFQRGQQSGGGVPGCVEIPAKGIFCDSGPIVAPKGPPATM